MERYEIHTEDLEKAFGIPKICHMVVVRNLDSKTGSRNPNDGPQVLRVVCDDSANSYRRVNITGKKNKDGVNAGKDKNSPEEKFAHVGKRIAGWIGDRDRLKKMKDAGF